LKQCEVGVGLIEQFQLLIVDHVPAIDVSVGDPHLHAILL
jgi:hypothetical protein